MNRKIIVQLLLFVCCAVESQTRQQPIVPAISPTIKFSENLGQWQSNVLLRANLKGGALFVEKNRLTFNFYDSQKFNRLHTGSLARGTDKDLQIKGHAFRVNFLNCSPASTLEKLQQSDDYENYFKGNDPSKWKSFVHSYAQVKLHELYPGIQYELLAAASGMKYNFHVNAGADPAVIALQYEGVDDLRLEQGELQVSTSINSIVEHKPYSYQIIDGVVKEVPCQFVLKNNVVSFEFPNGYDLQHVLVIDPVLVFSAQTGSTADNFGMTATYDSSGNLYSAGGVYDVGYPTTTGAYDSSFNNAVSYGVTDVFVTKYNSLGTGLIYSTYIGGSGTEVCASLIADKNNNLCLYGVTGSTNFPVTSGAAFSTFNGGTNIGFISNGTAFSNGTDVYVCKFNSSGTALIGSTYFGGSGNDGLNYLGGTSVLSYFNGVNTVTTNTSAYDSLLSNYGDQYRGEIQLDTLGNIYVCSTTRSSNIPFVNGFDNSLGGKQDAVIIKFNPSLTTLLYSTYLGGSNLESGNALFVTPASDIYVTGGTCSNDLPYTNSAHAATYRGGSCDGFISLINHGGGLVRSTYVGTSSYDNSFFVKCDQAGEVFVFGQSLGNIPVQAYSGFSVYNVPNTHQFIACYTSSLTTRLMSTVFGSKTNSFDISPAAFLVDKCNENIYLSGWGGGLVINTGSMTNMPLANPTQSTTDGHDFYLMALKTNASALLYGSYFGGNQSPEHLDGGSSRFDENGILYQSVCAGCGGHQDFPWTNGAWPCPGQATCPNRNLSGNCNNGVFKLDFGLHANSTYVKTNMSSGCAPLTVTLVNAFTGANYLWDFGNGNTSSVVANPVLTFTAPGTHTVSLTVNSDTLACSSNTIQTQSFTVFAIPQASASCSPTSVCVGGTAILSAAGASVYSWTGAATSAASSFTFSSSQATTHWFYVTSTDAHGCKDVDSVALVVNACLGLKKNQSKDVIHVSPNPNSGEFRVSAESALRLALMDELGQILKILELSESNNYNVNVRDLAEGLYFLTWEAEGQQSTQKIIVEK